MQTVGRHVIADIWLNEYDMKNISVTAEKALATSKMTIVGKAKHDFGGGAFSMIWLLSESHFTIHTFPERNFISVDCYSCGQEGDPLACITHLISKMDLKHVKIEILQRGIM